MDAKQKKEYVKLISERVREILHVSELEIKGLAAITEKSIDIYYAILNGKRSLTPQIAKTIGTALDFDGNIIFNLNTPIPQSIKDSPNLKKFKSENINNINFFTDTWSKSKDSTFIKEQLIQTGFFSERRYGWQINDELKRLGRIIDSDLLSKQLQYFVNQGILSSEPSPIKLRNGKYGKRTVFVYFT